MEKKKYKYRKGSKANTEASGKKAPKTRFSVKQRMVLLIVWSALSVGLYFLLAKVSFVYSLWFFALLLMVCFVLWFITGVQVSKYAQEQGEDSEKVVKLIDRGKVLLIVMIPLVFIIMYDFISSTFKMFM
ncbi:MAG: hypothetical protein E7583_07045 [Ruminococcaceae bacterium]|nr:hypothetical protein [Oscillospiraceae bacterium]